MGKGIRLKKQELNRGKVIAKMAQEEREQERETDVTKSSSREIRMDKLKKTLILLHS